MFNYFPSQFEGAVGSTQFSFDKKWNKMSWAGTLLVAETYFTFHLGLGLGFQTFQTF